MEKIIKSFLLLGMSLFFFLSSAQNRIAGDTAALNAYITNRMEEHHLPGVVTAIVHQDDLVWQKAYGYRDLERQRLMTDSTIFWMASVSKTITSTALMQMHELQDQTGFKFRSVFSLIPGRTTSCFPSRMAMTGQAG